MPDLLCHPDTPSAAARKITALATRRVDGQLELRWVVSGDIGRIRLPAPAAHVHTDGLWKTTCFECFVREDSTTAYREFNLAPSGAFAAYSFSGYREGMQPAALSAPHIDVTTTSSELAVTAVLPQTFAGNSHLAITAVIEENDGRKSYWALHHPSGKPDFHHPDTFVMLLP